MLKFLRKKTKIIVWIVVVAFAAWGGYAVSLQLNEASRSPGLIFGKEVSFRDHLLAFRAVQIFAPPSSKNEELPSAEEIETRTWEFLILSREAKKQKIKVNDEEVRRAIFDLFSKNGVVTLGAADYERWVRASLREEPHEFENQLREHLRIRKLLDQVRKESPENPDEGLKKWLVDLKVRAKLEVYKQQT